MWRETLKPDTLRGKFRFFEEFWKGEGPCGILFTEPHLAKGKPYRRHDLVEQHWDLQKHLDLIDDGIPTLRSDLGTALLPIGLGMRVEVLPELHPWLVEHLSPEQYQTLEIPGVPRDPRVGLPLRPGYAASLRSLPSYRGDRAAVTRSRPCRSVSGSPTR